jgi:hypothetical protein
MPQLPLALQLASLGWHVFPLAWRDKRPLANCPDCREVDGRPTHTPETCPCLPAGRWCHGVRAATVDPDRLTAWWTTEPRAVPGIAAGPSGLCLIDIDTGHDELPDDLATGLLPGIDLSAEDIPAEAWSDGARFRDGRDSLSLLARLRARTNSWPQDDAHRPVATATPSGGRHLWYRAPAPNLRQVIAKNNRNAFAWQVDIKAGWSYGIAPGARASAGLYKPMRGDLAQVGTMPGWLAAEVIRVASPTPPQRPPTSAPTSRPLTSTGRAGAYIDAVLDNGIRDLAGLRDGRKAALAALAYKLGGLIAGAGLDWATAESALIDAGIGTGLTPAIATRTVSRSMTNGRSRPISLPVSGRAD